MWENRCDFNLSAFWSLSETDKMHTLQTSGDPGPCFLFRPQMDRGCASRLVGNLCQSQWEELWAVLRGGDAEATVRVPLVKVSVCFLAQSVVDIVLREGIQGVKPREALARKRLLADPQVGKVVGQLHACTGGPAICAARAWVKSLCMDRFWTVGAPGGVQWGPVGSAGWTCLRDTAQWVASSGGSTSVVSRCKATLVDLMVLLVDHGLAGLLLAACAPGGSEAATTATDAVVDVVLRSSWVSVPPTPSHTSVKTLSACCPEVCLVLQEGGRVWSAHTTLYAVGGVCRWLREVKGAHSSLVAVAYGNVCSAAGRVGGGALIQSALASVLHCLVVPCLRDLWSRSSGQWACVRPCVVEPLLATLTGPVARSYSGGMLVDLVGALVEQSLATAGPAAAVEVVDVVVAAAKLLAQSFHTHDNVERMAGHALTLQRGLARYTWPFQLGLVAAALLPLAAYSGTRPRAAALHHDRSALFTDLKCLLHGMQVPFGTSGAVVAASQPVVDAVVTAYLGYLTVQHRGQMVDVAKAVARVATHPLDVVAALGPRGDVLVPFVASLPHVRAWSPLRAFWVQTVVRLGLVSSRHVQGPRTKVQRVQY